MSLSSESWLVLPVLAHRLPVKILQVLTVRQFKAITTISLDDGLEHQRLGRPGLRQYVDRELVPRLPGVHSQPVEIADHLVLLLRVEVLRHGREDREVVDVGVRTLRRLRKHRDLGPLSPRPGGVQK